MRRGLLVLYAMISFLLVPSLGLAQAKGDAKAGKAKYDSLCGGCHGTTGKGDGPASGCLNPKPQDHTNPESRLIFMVSRGAASKKYCKLGQSRGLTLKAAL